MNQGRWIIPDSWSWTTAGDIARIVGGGTPPSKDPTNFSDNGLPWITPADLTGYKEIYIEKGSRDLSEKGYKKCGSQLLPKGSVLLSSRAPIGYCAIAKNEISTNQGFKSLVLNEGLVPEYIRYYLLSSKAYLESLASGTTFKELSGSRTSNIFIPVAPTKEQRRIVAKLDRLFERTRRAREELSHIPLLIENYKKAILVAAFRGDLTKDWRSNNRVVAGEPWCLPVSWVWGKFENLAEVASHLVSPSEVLDLPHIAPNHIESGVPRLLPYQTVREDNLKSAKHRFFPGQIIYSKIRPYLRKAVLVDFDGVCSADMYPLNAKCEPLYLLYWLLSPNFNDLALEHQGRVVLPKINQTALNRIPTPIPPEDEQAEIARRIEAAMKWLDVVATEQSSAAKLLDHLDQANLAKAFRGELVPQDPSDEPASVLLEQIYADREKQVKIRKNKN